MDTAIEALTKENVNLQDELETVKGLVFKQSKQIASLQHKLSDQIARSMENNLILTGLQGDLPKADPLAQVYRFISEKMELNFNPNDVIEANRMGLPTRGKHQAILFQCTPQLRKYLLKNTPILAEKFNESGERYYVNQQVPEQIAEIKREIRQVVKETKKLEEHKDPQQKSTILVRSNNLYINGQKHKKKLCPPTVPQLFPEDEQKQINKIRFCSSETKPESGSNFTAMVCSAKSMNEVCMAYSKLFQQNPAADHIAAAFAVERETGYQDNGEFGSGFHLLECLKSTMLTDLAVFLICNYGGTHLGTRRFKIMKEVALEALDNYIKKNPKSE